MLSLQASRDMKSIAIGPLSALITLRPETCRASSHLWVSSHRNPAFATPAVPESEGVSEYGWRSDWENRWALIRSHIPETNREFQQYSGTAFQRSPAKGLRICKGLKMARVRNNTKRQDCGHNWWFIRILTLYSEVWTWKRNTCLCHQVKNGSNVIECQLSEKLESQGDGSLAAERYPRNSTASEYESKNFGK